MKKLFAILALIFATNAFAELPPPGTARRGPIKVRPNNGDEYTYDLSKQAVINRADRRRVQKLIDDLRSKVRRLEAENRFLKEESARPVVASTPRAAQTKQVVEVRTITKKNRLSALAGIGPTSLTNNRKERSAGNQIGIENGPVVGGQYQRLIGETFSLGGIVTVPTRPDTKKPTYLLSAGVDF